MKLPHVNLMIVFIIGICNTSVLSIEQDKIIICHNQACPEGDVHSNPSITLEINENALQSHLDHGDMVGACDECDGDECDAGCESDEDCGEIEFCDTESGECVTVECESNEDCNDNQICNTQTGECVDTNETCDDVICDEGFACVHGQCFAVVINDGNDGNDGSDGQDGSQGLSGSSGSDGQDGVNGEDGSSCTVITVGNCAAIHCDDGTEALVCNGQEGESCTINEVDENVLINCPDGTSVTVGNINFDDDSDGATNDIDQCPGTPRGFWVNEVGCMLVQKQPPPPYNGECDPGMDLFGGDQDGHFCGICGSGCELSFAMLFVGLAFLRKRGI